MPRPIKTSKSGVKMEMAGSRFAIEKQGSLAPVCRHTQDVRVGALHGVLTDGPKSLHEMTDVEGDGAEN
jgi:hypothetical protein